MVRREFLWVVAALCGGGAASAAEKPPSVEEFKRVFEAQLQKLKPQGFTVRTVLFQAVTPGKSQSGYYPFQVTAIIHDYGPGYPANKYYGLTRVGKMDRWKFDMRRDEFGDWIVQGRLTVTDSESKENPAEGVSAVPVESLPGKPLGPAAAAARPARTEPAAKGATNLYLGEYAAYGTGGRLMAGMGFHLKPGGRYHDVDGRRGGTYVYNAGAATIAFKGGFLDGQTGRNVRNTGFDLSATVRCEPWR